MTGGLPPGITRRSVMIEVKTKDIGPYRWESIVDRMELVTPELYYAVTAYKYLMPFLDGKDKYVLWHSN